jgi:Kef-type K+ transport system membrane component KefB
MNNKRIFAIAILTIFYLFGAVSLVYNTYTCGWYFIASMAVIITSSAIAVYALNVLKNDKNNKP